MQTVVLNNNKIIKKKKTNISMVGFHPGVRYPIELQFPWREASNGLSEDATSSLVLIGITKGDLDKELDSVSYTHLTLPTNMHVCRSRWSPYH